jgi:cytochrome c oxidase subunit 1
VKNIIILYVLSVLFTLFPLSAIWSQQNLAIGLNPFVGIIILLLILLIAIGVIIRTKKFLDKHISLKPGVLFIIGLISFLNLMLWQSIIILDSSPYNNIKDNYNLFSFFNPILIVIVAFSIFAVTYHWFEAIFKRKINQSLGYIHFWITFIGVCFIILPFQELQLIRQARRYLDFSKMDNNSYLDVQNIFMSTITTIIIGAQLLFIYNICYSLLGKDSRKIIIQNRTLTKQE